MTEFVDQVLFDAALWMLLAAAAVICLIVTSHAAPPDRRNVYTLLAVST